MEEGKTRRRDIRNKVPQNCTIGGLNSGKAEDILAGIESISVRGC